MAESSAGFVSARTASFACDRRGHFAVDRLMMAGGPTDGVAIWRPDVGLSRVYGQLGFGYAHNAVSRGQPS